MQCSRCASVVADTVTLCPRCGNPLSARSAPAAGAAPLVDSYGASQDVAFASTLMAGSSPVPATLISGAGAPSPLTPSPRYVATPAPQQAPASPYAPPPPTMHSAPMIAPGPPSPYAPPPPPGGFGYPPSYPPAMQPMQLAPAQPTPGLAIASLICGLLGLVPLWIGFVLCLLAITFGGVVLAQTRPGHPGRGLAVTGLAFGLAFLLPAACGL